MKEVTKMVEEITRKRKMPPSVKENLNKKVFLNICLAIGMIVYFYVMNVVYQYATEEISTIILKGMPMIAIGIAVVVFEMAYRKENGRLGVIGIELCLFSIVTLYWLPICTWKIESVSRIFVLTPGFIAFYYVIKSFFDYIRTKKDYQNHLSDVKEIVKED